MWKAALAGALALATMGTSLAFADDFGSDNYSQMQPRAQSADASEVNSRISQFKSALHLKVEQQRHWPRVEAVLRDLARQRNVEEASAGGFVQRISDRASSVVSTAGAIKRLVSAARPLINSLDQEQKQVALSLAHNMGFGSVAAHFE